MAGLSEFFFPILITTSETQASIMAALSTLEGAPAAAARCRPIGPQAPSPSKGAVQDPVLSAAQSFPGGRVRVITAEDFPYVLVPAGTHCPSQTAISPNSAAIPSPYIALHPPACITRQLYCRLG